MRWSDGRDDFGVQPELGLGKHWAAVNAWHPPFMVLTDFFGTAFSLFRKLKFRIRTAFWNAQITRNVLGNKIGIGVRIPPIFSIGTFGIFRETITKKVPAEPQISTSKTASREF